MTEIVKLEVTVLQRANILSAKEMWLKIPKAKVKLSQWRSDRKTEREAPTCKTIACFGGWCAYWPVFQAQGLKATNFGAPMFEGGRTYTDYLNVAKILFGAPKIFSIRGYHEADEGFGANEELEYEYESDDEYEYRNSISDARTSDWDVVMKRIEYTIANSVVIKARIKGTL